MNEQFPVWVPKEVLDWIEKGGELFDLPPQYTNGLARLLEDSRMEEVFGTLAKHRGKEDALINFITTAWMARHLEEDLEIPKEEDVLALIHKISRKSVELADFIDDSLFDIEFSMDHELKLDVITLFLAYFDSQKAGLTEYHLEKWDGIISALKKMQEDDMDHYLHITDCLKVLPELLEGKKKFLSRGASQEAQKIIPTRRADKNAKQTYFQRLLSNCVLENYGKPLHQVVATITNIAFGLLDKPGLPDEEVTSDNVRSNTRDIRKKYL